MNMKKIRTLLCSALAALMLLSACSQDTSGNSQNSENSEKEAEILLPISINGKEIRVGETTVQTLLDQGLDISWVDENFQRIIVDPATELEADSYYTGCSISMADNLSLSISMATDEEAVLLGQAVIACLELHIFSEDDQSILGAISFDGVPITELTREKAGDKYPDWSGDENMWLHYGLDYKYSLGFDNATGSLRSFTVERTYDVDWNS